MDERNYIWNRQLNVYFKKYRSCRTAIEEISCCDDECVCLCGWLSAYFFPPYGCDSGMTCFSMLACLHTFPVLFIPLCVRLCYANDHRIGLFLRSSPVPLRQSNKGELRTRLRSSELRECSFDVWCHCSRLLVHSAGLLWRSRLGPGGEGCGLAILRRIQLLTRPR